jgi:F-box protein 9
VQPYLPASARDKKEKLGLIQKMLPEDVMLEIFMRMTPVAVSRAACCCRAWRLLANHEKVWERACYEAWEYREQPEDTERIARDRFHGSWRGMFFNRVRLRTEGIYVSRNTYVKPGITDWENVNPVHLVGLYKLSAVVTHSLKGAWFQPLS